MVVIRSLMAVGVLLLLGVFAPADPPFSLPWQVTTFVGDGVAGWLDGPKGHARLNWPTDVAVAEDWTVYVADFGNNLIRRVSPDGVVTTLAGSGEAAFADGRGAAAAFNGPNGLAIGPDGLIYVADAGNARIRRITPDGTVTTFAGSGTRGLVDGPGEAASFSYPTGLAFDHNGVLYVVDRWAHVIRMVLANGEVRTVAGNGQPGFQDGHGTDARFNHPLSVTWDPHWGLVVTDSGNHALRRILPDGTVSTLVGGPLPGSRDGNWQVAGFNWNTGIASDGHGNLYIADANNHRLRRVSRSRHVSTVAGSGLKGMLDGPGPHAQFAFLTGVTVDPAGNLLLADSAAHRIRRAIRGQSGMAGIGWPGMARAWAGGALSARP